MSESTQIPTSTSPAPSPASPPSLADLAADVERKGLAHTSAIARAQASSQAATDDHQTAVAAEKDLSGAVDALVAAANARRP